jgi:hypothetical protein
MYRWFDDGLEIVIKLFSEFDRDEDYEIERENKKWTNVTTFHMNLSREVHLQTKL